MPVSDEFSQRAWEVGRKQSWVKSWIFLWDHGLFHEGHPHWGIGTQGVGKEDGML